MPLLIFLPVADSLLLFRNQDNSLYPWSATVPDKEDGRHKYYCTNEWMNQ